MENSAASPFSDKGVQSVRLLGADAVPNHQMGDEVSRVGEHRPVSLQQLRRMRAVGQLPPPRAWSKPASFNAVVYSSSEASAFALISSHAAPATRSATCSCGTVLESTTSRRANRKRKCDRAFVLPNNSFRIVGMNYRFPASAVVFDLS